MLTEQPILITSVKAAVDISKNFFVSFDGNLCSADAKALGVCNADTSANNEMPVTVKGIALVYSGGAITQGSAVSSDANGKAVAAANFSVSVPSGTTGVTSNAAQPDLTEAGSVLPQAINGYALDAASGADELIRVMLV